MPAEAFAVAERICVERDWPLVHPYTRSRPSPGRAPSGWSCCSTHRTSRTGWWRSAAADSRPVWRWRWTGAPGWCRSSRTGCPTLAEAQLAGGPVRCRAQGVARTSLGAPILGDLAWAVLRERVGRAHLVTDDEIVDAQRWLWSEVRVVAEPGGATALAALLSGRWTPPDGAVVGAVVCGGNADALPGLTPPRGDPQPVPRSSSSTCSPSCTVPVSRNPWRR